MAYVIDTHTLVWFLTNNNKLGDNALKLLRLADENKELIIIPTIILAEIFYICEKKKAGIEFKKIIEKIENSSNYIVYDLDLEVILELDKLSRIKELHDRIIVATALLTDSKLLTKDENIIDSKYIDILW